MSSIWSPTFHLEIKTDSCTVITTKQTETLPLVKYLHLFNLTHNAPYMVDVLLI